MLYSFKFQLPVFSDRQNLQNSGRFWIINDFLIIFQKITFKSWIIKAFDKIIQQRPFQTPETGAQEHASWNTLRDDQIIPRNPIPRAGSPRSYSSFSNFSFKAPQTGHSKSSSTSSQSVPRDDLLISGASVLLKCHYMEYLLYDLCCAALNSNFLFFLTVKTSKIQDGFGLLMII